MNGTNTMIKFVPSEDIAVVVLINTASDLRQKLPNDIIGVLLPNYGAKWKAERDKPAERRVSSKPAAELIGEWRGEIKTYEETAPMNGQSTGGSVQRGNCVSSRWARA